jgi:ankyrin repeat protein
MHTLNVGIYISDYTMTIEITKSILIIYVGADLNYSDPAETSTPLLSACYAGNLEIATFLVENGARVNDRYANIRSG